MTKELKNRRTKKLKNNYSVLLFFGSFVLLFFVFGYSPTLAQTSPELQIIPSSPFINRAVETELIGPAASPAIPPDKILVSSIFRYAALPATDNRLDNPLTFKFAYPAEENRFKEIFVYDESQAKWLHLPGAIESASATLTAQTTLASGFAAVLADRLERSEYLKADINAPSLLVVDAQSGEILIERESERQRSIASLTKMMTAAVFLDNKVGWQKMVTMQKSDDTIPAKIYVKTGDKISTRDLFFATLVHSANNAAKALARSTGLSEAEFARQMNAKAKALGMNSTHFVEPSGLSESNVSTAADYLKLTQTLLRDKIFLEATTLKTYRLSLLRGKKTVKLTVQNSNKILNSPYIITGSKTGYTTEAGRCLMIRAKNKAGREVIAIIMGGTVPGRQWSDMNALLAAALGGEGGYKLANK